MSKMVDRVDGFNGVGGSGVSGQTHIPGARGLEDMGGWDSSPVNQNEMSLDGDGRRKRKTDDLDPRDEQIRMLLEQHAGEVQRLRAEVAAERSRADKVEEKVVRKISNKTHQMVIFSFAMRLGVTRNWRHVTTPRPACFVYFSSLDPQRGGGTSRGAEHAGSHV